MSGAVVGDGRVWRPSVADEGEYARSQMELRAPRTPPSVAAASPFAVPDLPWDRLEDRGKALSPREVQLLTLIRDGATNKQVAHTMGTSEQTTKNHMSSILRKTGAPDRTAALVLAMRDGLIPLGYVPNEGDLGAWVRQITDRQSAIATDMSALSALVSGLTRFIEDRPTAEPPPSPRPTQPPAPRSGHCVMDGCDEPSAAYGGRGRPPLKCEHHIVRRAA